MAIKTDYTHSGIPISGAYLRLNRITHGGKRVGQWIALIGVYANEEKANPKPPEPAAVDEEAEGAQHAAAVFMPQPEAVTEFALSVPWVEGGVPEALVYAELKKQYPNATDV